MKKILFAGIVLLGMSNAVSAAIMAGGPMYGGPGQAQGVCYIYNAGSTAVTFGSKSIVREPNVSVGLIYDNCGATLAAGRSCGISANIVNYLAHSCRVIVNPSSVNVRGVFETRDASGNVLSNTELR